MWPNSGSLDSGSRDLGSSPGRVIVLCSWAKYFPLTVPLSTEEYKLSTGKSSWKPDKTVGDNQEKVGSTANGSTLCSFFSKCTCVIHRITPPVKY